MLAAKRDVELPCLICQQDVDGHEDAFETTAGKRKWDDDKNAIWYYKPGVDPRTSAAVDFMEDLHKMTDEEVYDVLGENGKLLTEQFLVKYDRDCEGSHKTTQDLRFDPTNPSARFLGFGRAPAAYKLLD